MKYSVSFVNEDGQIYEEDKSLTYVLALLVAAEEENIGELEIALQKDK